MTTSHSDNDKPAVLVIGGRGFLGSAIVQGLARNGYKPHLFGPLVQTSFEGDARFPETIGSIENRDEIKAAIIQSGATQILHLAAHSAGPVGLMRSGEMEADSAIAINASGLRNVLQVAQENGIGRMVWASSTVVYGPADRYSALVDEDALREPQTVYGLTKVLAEDIAAYYRDRHAMQIVGIRVPLVLGPSIWYKGAAATFIDLCRAPSGSSPTISFHDEIVDFAHVEDIAAAFLVALEAPSPQRAIYNLVGFRARMSDFLGRLREAPVALTPTFDITPPATLFPLVDGSRFEREFGFSYAHDLTSTIDSLRQHISK